VCSYLLESKLRIRDDVLQAAVSDRNSLLAGDCMRVGYHGCVRGTTIRLGARLQCIYGHVQAPRGIENDSNSKTQGVRDDTS